MNVVFDTGSDWLMVESYECWNCEGVGNSTGEAYNTTKGIIMSEDTDKLEQRLYGEVFLEGFEYADKVCTTLTDCVSNFTYFGILEQRGIVEPVDGILGMARNYPIKNADADAKTPVSRLFVDAMVEDGLINENTFTF